MKILNADDIQDERPSLEEIFQSIRVGDSIRIAFDHDKKPYIIMQLLLVESKDEASQTVTGIIDEDLPLDERITIDDELITVNMHQVFGVMSNEFTYTFH